MCSLYSHVLWCIRNTTNPKQYNRSNIGLIAMKLIWIMALVNISHWIRAAKFRIIAHFIVC